jgi:hypothetical protein
MEPAGSAQVARGIARAAEGCIGWLIGLTVLVPLVFAAFLWGTGRLFPSHEDARDRNMRLQADAAKRERESALDAETKERIQEVQALRSGLPTARAVRGEVWTQAQISAKVQELITSHAINRVEAGPPAKLHIKGGFAGVSLEHSDYICRLVFWDTCGRRDRTEKLAIVDDDTGDTIGEFSERGLGRH